MTPSQEERLAVMEQKFSDQAEQFRSHLITCGRWQERMYEKLDKLSSDMQKRLPLWATCTGGLLLAVIGWFANAQFG